MGLEEDEVDLGVEGRKKVRWQIASTLKKTVNKKREEITPICQQLVDHF